MRFCINSLSVNNMTTFFLPYLSSVYRKVQTVVPGNLYTRGLGTNVVSNYGEGTLCSALETTSRDLTA